MPSFGGGLNVSAHPAFIRNDEWAWADGWSAKDGRAETLPPWVAAPGTIAAGYVPVGLARNPFHPILRTLVGAVGPANAVKLYETELGGIFQEIPWDGIGTAPVGNPLTGMTAAFLNGFLVLCFGPTTGPYSLIKLNSDVSFSTIEPTNPLRGLILTSFGAHLVLAGTAQTRAGARTIRWSDVNNESIWEPAVDNSADFAVLDELESGIIGLARVGANALGVFTREATHVLTPTGSIPAFTRQFGDNRGCETLITAGLDYDPFHSCLTETPYGVLVRSTDDFYFVGNAQGVGRKIFAYYRTGAETDGGVLPMPHYRWHPRRGVVLIPRLRKSVGAATTLAEMLMLDPVNGAWTRQTLPTVTTSTAHYQAHNVTHTFAIYETTGIPTLVHAVIGKNATIYSQVPDELATSAPVGNFIDSKDFAFDEPSDRDYADRITVDWEALSAGATLTVSSSVRNDFLPALLGSVGGELAALSYSVHGTLSGGGGSLPIRLKGKFIRFRFLATGRVRIRGFTIRRERASDRRVGA